MRDDHDNLAEEREHDRELPGSEFLRRHHELLAARIDGLKKSLVQVENKPVNKMLASHLKDVRSMAKDVRDTHALHYPDYEPIENDEDRDTDNALDTADAAMDLAGDAEESGDEELEEKSLAVADAALGTALEILKAEEDTEDDADAFDGWGS